jgi:hypothetical protein
LALDELDLGDTKSSAAPSSAGTLSASQATGSTVQLCADFVRAARSARAEHVLISAPRMTLPLGMTSPTSSQRDEVLHLAHGAILKELRETGESDNMVSLDSMPSFTVAWKVKANKCKAKFDSGKISDAATFVAEVSKS